MHDPYAVLRRPVFRRMLLIHMSEVCAFHMLSVTIGWLIYQATHSAAILGLYGLAIFVPHLLLALPVGHWADHRSLKALCSIGYCCSFLGALGIAVATALSASVWWMFPYIVVCGIGNVFVAICVPVIFRICIDSAQTENSANWTSLTRRIATITGSIGGGMIIASSWGPISALLLTALLRGVCMMLMYVTRIPKRQIVSSVRSIHELTKGIRYVAKTPIVRSAMMVDLIAGFFGGCTGLLPLFAEDILHVGAAGLGWLRAAPSIGAGLATLFLTHRPPLLRAGVTMLAAVSMYGIMITFFGFSESFFLSLSALLLMGAFDAISITVRSSILQTVVPSHIRGRMYAVNILCVYTSNELGDFESGIIAAMIGGPTTVILGGAATLVLTVLAAWRWRELRTLGTITSLQPAQSHMSR